LDDACPSSHLRRAPTLARAGIDQPLTIAQSNDCFQRAMCRFAVIVDPDALVLREQSSVAVL
jgi:hypothetical protein